MTIILFILFSIIFLVVFFVLRIFSFVIRPKSTGSVNNGQRKGSRFTFTRRQESKKVFEKNEGEYVDFEEIN